MIVIFCQRADRHNRQGGAAEYVAAHHRDKSNACIVNNCDVFQLLLWWKIRTIMCFTHRRQ